MAHACMVSSTLNSLTSFVSTSWHGNNESRVRREEKTPFLCYAETMNGHKASMKGFKPRAETIDIFSQVGS